jgi:hypothetical protein
VARAGTTRPYEMIALVFLSGGVADVRREADLSQRGRGVGRSRSLPALAGADCAIGMAGMAQVLVSSTNKTNTLEQHDIDA